jgi:DNA polymerase V
MDSTSKTYIAIDLKSFYASVECVERGLDPLTTNLVVADASRTEKTICLAVSPSLKEYGIPGRPRLFEVIGRVKQINSERLKHTSACQFTGKSSSVLELQRNKELALDYIVAPPRMKYYIDFCSRIYKVYLKYIAPEDIFPYSIDEVFIDATEYLKLYKMSAYQLTMQMVTDVLKTTGITATAGIGTNMYLCKIAMDIYAKHSQPNENGVRIAALDERTYREKLWNYKPLTKFWHIGNGIAKRLEPFGIDTMGKLARFSLQQPDRLYAIFGVNAEILIDHAWGWEPCTMQMIKQYRPLKRSISAGQVLSHPYNFQNARIVVQEMAEELSMSLVKQNFQTNSVTLSVHYDSAESASLSSSKKIIGKLKVNRNGKIVPKHAHGTKNVKHYTSSQREIINLMISIYDEIVNPSLYIRRINVTANNIEVYGHKHPRPVIQLDLFENISATPSSGSKITTEKERKIQKALLDIKSKWGKNAILKGIDFSEEATTISRNSQIGGHKA